MRVDPNYLSGLAAAIDQSSNAESTLTSELSSGLSVTSLQSNPTAVAQSILLGSSISQDDSFIQSATGTEGMLQVADSTLGEVVTQVTSALSLAVQGSNGTQSSSDTTSIAQQLTSIRDEVVSLANTSYQGTYLFAGSQQGGSVPYSMDSSTTPASLVYTGDSNVRSIETSTGQKIQTSLPGSSIFGGNGSSGVLTALNQLISDFSSGTASASATSDTAALTNALTQLSSQRSILDSSLSRLQQTSTYAQTQATELTAQQGTLVAADIATVATQLSSAETQHQAMLSVVAALGNSNNDLFSYVK